MKPLPKLPPALVAAKSPANTAPVQKVAPAPPAVRPPIAKPTGGVITKTLPATPPKNDRLFVPPPKSPHNPRLPVLDDESWIEGSFLSEGHDPFVVETRLTGNPTSDHQALVNLAMKKYPTGKMKQASTRIFMRSRGTPASVAPGETLGHLFGEDGSPTEAAIEIGKCFYDGASCQIFLRNLRSRNAVTIALRPNSGGQVTFSNQLAQNRTVSELPLIVKEILGNGAREIVITLREAK